MAPGNSELKCFSLAAVGARSRNEIPSALSAGTTSRKSVVLPAPAIPETSITISPEVHRKAQRRFGSYHRVLDLALALDERRALAPGILDCGQHMAFFLANMLGRDVAAFAVEPDEGRASSVGQGILEGEAAAGSAQKLAHHLHLVNH